MTRTNRRALLLSSTGTLIASLIDDTAFANVSSRHERSHELPNLIEAHRIAYAAFCKAFHATVNKSDDIAARSREEEEALMAICSFQAGSRNELRAKAEYLLEVEARGELDLREQMQAVLQSML